MATPLFLRPLPVLLLAALAGSCAEDPPGGAGGSAAAGSSSGGEGGAAGAAGGTSTGGGGAGGGVPQGEELNPGWIGGACDTVADCQNPDAICEMDGFPAGMCTQACTLGGSGIYVCPDTDTSPDTLNTVSRCIDAGAGDPHCVSECDFDKSPTGCRPGYGCVLRQRYNQPDAIFPVCLPLAAGGWPGEPAPPFDIGEPCGAASDCSHLACLDLPGGYCVKTMCEFTGCPAGSTCFSFENSDVTACLLDCNADNDCRAAEGYTCDPEAVCWSGTTAPPWDSSMGAVDCQTAWSQGLSPCDTAPDHYIVVRKGDRNMAFCHQGALLANFNVGLGFSPVGDKEWEGDGRTPEGVFYISMLVPDSSYYKGFLLSYPDAEDAQRGLDADRITPTQYNAILNAQVACTTPPQQTQLGGLVEVHGMGGGDDWTWGCVAIDNSEIDVLWAQLGLGDTIVVIP